MNVRQCLRAAVMASTLVLSACSAMHQARHEYVMRGQVVEVNGKDAVVCVGTRDGARAGQELTVYEIVATNVGAPARTPARWKRVEVGSVRIAQVMDEHFARAEIVRGEVEANDIVELQR